MLKRLKEEIIDYFCRKFILHTHKGNLAKKITIQNALNDGTGILLGIRRRKPWGAAREGGEEGAGAWCGAPARARARGAPSRVQRNAKARVRRKGGNMRQGGRTLIQASGLADVAGAGVAMT